jgi:glycosyltransferase involved in cell wall biosynthesis
MILHISADYPDPIAPAKTRAVQNLLAATNEIPHAVYSINRVNWPSGVSAVPFAEGCTALSYGAPPYGIGLTHYLQPVIRWIVQDVKRLRLKPLLIHAHKFTVEGLIAAELARVLNCRFIASLWGDTDTKIFEAKPGLRRRYRAIAAQAAMLLPAAPWTAHYFAGALALPQTRMKVLPVMTAGDVVLPPEMRHAPQLVSVFSLDAWHRKGLDILAKAMALVAQDIPDVTLDLYGSGHSRSRAAAENVLRKAGATDLIRLKGPLPHSDVQQVMNRYAAFAMAPRRETYGMVHVEALLAGLPILWSKGRGIDGLLPQPLPGYRADPSSARDVAAGIRHLIAGEAALKQGIRSLQAHGGLDHLRRAAIADRYRDLLARLTNASLAGMAAQAGSDSDRQMPRVS